MKGLVGLALGTKLLGEDLGATVRVGLKHSTCVLVLVLREAR